MEELRKVNVDCMTKLHTARVSYVAEAELRKRLEAEQLDLRANTQVSVIWVYLLVCWCV